MKNQPTILVVDDVEDDKALAEIVLRDRLPAARVLVADDPVHLGRILSAETIQAAVVNADLGWCDPRGLVQMFRQHFPDCLVIFYSDSGIGELTPEIAELGLVAYYRKGAGSLLEIPRVLASRLESLLTPVVQEHRQSGAAQRQDAAQDSRKEGDEASDNAFRSEMFYTISHDLKQPLHIFIRQVKMLDKNYKGQLDTAGKELIENMAKVAEHMAMLLDSIFSYYRPEAEGSGKDNENLAQIAEVVQAVLTAFQSNLEDVAARVVVGELPDLQVNKGRLLQLFQNLVSNAIKFRGEDPLVIEITAVDVTDNWLFTVQDNGIGIAKGEQDQIFTMLKRLHNRDKYPGSGVGLALCKRIVEQQGGKIWARSQPGEGMSIHFTLPKQPRLDRNISAGRRLTKNDTSDKGIAGRG